MTYPISSSDEIAQLRQQAELYQAQGLHSYALEVYRKILRRDPSDKEAALKIRDLSSFEVQRPDPETPLTQTVDLTPRLALDLGLAYMGMNLYAEAVDELRKGLKSSPALRTEILRQMAVCLIHMERAKEAGKILEEVLATRTLTPAERGSIINDTAGVYLEKGLFREARELLAYASDDCRMYIQDLDKKIAQLSSLGPREDLELAAEKTKPEEPDEVVRAARAGLGADGGLARQDVSKGAARTDTGPGPAKGVELADGMGRPARQKPDKRARESKIPTLPSQEAIETEEQAAAAVVRFACLCGKVLSASKKLRGEQRSCTECGRVLTIPWADLKKDSLTELVLGMVLGGCRILHKIGGGGMGGVYRGHHLGLDIDVAVKILHSHLAETDSVFIKRFIREARAAAKLQHPNIVGVMNVGFEEGFHFIVMPFVAGGSASSVLSKSGKLPVAQVLEIASQIASALNAAAEAGILHRDIKPANILFTEKGEAKLADLGLAKSYADGTDTAITQTGIACGTPLYFSPEQAKGSPNIDIRSDIYSLGITLYHLIEGSPPFMAETAYVIFQKHVHEDLPPFKNAAEPVPEPVFRLIQKMTAKEPKYRFKDPQELLEAIELVKDEIAGTESPGPVKKGLLERLGITRTS